ncbi:hypothetical protein BP6252_13760 [Coleophoma cylindrospora]|uniref:FAS1 domain-containing protein n=1 Tax=Coleophoma cylindrospora TaxID=1849047 RepID=A0A3D8Q758_9HELO|nr:hypothetical protein BP6252_13760 [Coleophoma cylindrospora]
MRFILILYLAIVVRAQSFLEAIGAYPQLSNFTSLLTDYPVLASSLLSASATSPQTILVPDNTAFLNYENLTGIPVSAVPTTDLAPVIQYHILSGLLKSHNFAAPQGITIPTSLVGQKYDNRTAGAALSSVGATNGNHDGQVVFIVPKTNDSTTTLLVRQLSSAGAVVQSGLGQQVNLTAIDGTWDGGSFHIVDGFLTLPEVCTETIQTWGLSSLDDSLNRTGLSSTLDHLNNVTCLGPSDQAFLQAGSPDIKANVSTLTNALMFHTIPEPLYSNFLQDGQTFTSLSNGTIRVTLKDGDIFFNDAKVTQANVITNNGLMHVLDRVMSPLEDASATGTTTVGPLTTPVASTVTSSITTTVTATESSSAPSSSNTAQATSAAAALHCLWRWEALAFLVGHVYLL